MGNAPRHDLICGKHCVHLYSTSVIYFYCALLD